MDLVFPFKNIAVNSFLKFVQEREHISDFILTQKGEYPYSDNYFLGQVRSYKNNIPNYENELLQIINTTNQESIDTYFAELKDNIEYIQMEIELKEINAKVDRWNQESMIVFNENVERNSKVYFESEDRKRGHLEEYEAVDYGGILGLTFHKNPIRIKKINYNYYCVEEQPGLIDESFCDDYQKFVSDLADSIIEFANFYLSKYNAGDIKSNYKESQLFEPIVFVEGEHDITYISKAAELLGKQELLDQVQIRQRGGCSNLDKIWNVYKENNWDSFIQKKILLYDCDVNKTDEQEGYIYKRVIKQIPGHIISKGIENLFPNSLIERAIDHKRAFVDVTKVERIKRGKTESTVSNEVNLDEKKNLCNWICNEASAQDFKHFESVFGIIQKIIKD